MEEDGSIPRPLFRHPSIHERNHPDGHPGGLSLSRRPDLGRAYTRPGPETRVFLVYPQQVAVDSSVPNQRIDCGWQERYNQWDPPGYDWKTGVPTSRRGQMSPAVLRRFGRSPLHTDQYGVEDEVILRRDARPEELSWAEYLQRFPDGPR